MINRRYLNPLKRAESDRVQTPGNISSDDNRRAKTTPTDRRLYVNDDLTKSRQQLLYRCRQENKSNKIADCWSTDGTILIKTLDHKIAAVRNATELERMCVCVNTDNSTRDLTKRYTRTGLLVCYCIHN